MTGGLPLFLLGLLLLVPLWVTASDSLRQRTRIRRRLAGCADILEARDVSAVAPAANRDTSKPALSAALDRRYPLAGGTRTTVAAGLTAAVAAAALAPALVFLGVPLLIALVTSLVVGGAMAVLAGSVLEGRQRDLYQTRFLVAIEDFERMVRYGIGAAQALSSTASSAEEPVQSSLRRVVQDADLGVPLGAALGHEAHRVRISEMAMLAAIISTQSRAGGGLAESVGNLSGMLRERLDNRARLRAATSEPKISLMILSAIPFAGVGLQAATQPEIVTTLLNSGRHLLGIGAAMIAVGLFVSFLIVRSARQ